MACEYVMSANSIAFTTGCVRQTTVRGPGESDAAQHQHLVLGVHADDAVRHVAGVVIDVQVDQAFSA